MPGWRQAGYSPEPLTGPSLRSAHRLGGVGWLRRSGSASWRVLGWGRRAAGVMCYHGQTGLGRGPILIRGLPENRRAPHLAAIGQRSSGSCGDGERSFADLGSTAGSRRERISEEIGNRRFVRQSIGRRHR